MNKASENSDKKIKDYYNRIAEEYDANRFGTSYGVYLDKVEVHFLAAFELSGNVLDIGCGTGRFLGKVTNIGIDFVPRMAKITRKKGYPVIISEARELPFKDDCFDHVVIMHLLMHVPDAFEVLREASRVVKKGGSVVFDIPNKTRRHITRFNPKGWHAQNAFNFREINMLCKDCCLRVNRTYGCMFFPIHRIFKKIRNLLLPIEYVIDNTPLKHLSSYYIIQSLKTM